LAPLGWTWRLAALTALSLACLAAPAAATHVQCGDTVTQDTTLDSDLRDCPRDGVVVEPGVTLDLGGHMIDGTGGGTGIWARDGTVTVRNGSVREFNSGLYTDEARFLLSRMRIVSNGAGIEAFGGGADLRDSVVARNRVGTWEASPIMRSRFTGNSEVAIGMSEQVGTVTDNVVSGNGAGILVGENDGTVARNRVTDNRGLGISWHFSGQGAIRDNVVARNGNGIAVGTFASPQVTGNVVTRNAGYGIRGHWDHDVGSHIAGNLVSRNGGDGVVVTGNGPCATVERNAVSRNGENGILVTDTTDVSTCPQERIADNRVIRNRLDGIHVSDNRGPVLLDRNRAERNGDDGIDVDPLPLELFAPAWSPDGSRIAFTVAVGPHRSLFAAAPAGGHPAQLTPFGARPVWSPDGERVAFDSGGDVYVVAPGGQPVRVAAGADPAWSPDGRTLAFARGDSIYVVPASGGDARRLTQGWDPVWSPDGEEILYGWDRQVLLIDPDGGAPRAVGDGFGGAWSPNGGQVAFSKSGDLAVVNRDGTGERVLTTGPEEDSAVAWSPDGEWIAFRRTSIVNGVGGDSLHVVRPDATGLRTLVTPAVLGVNGMPQPVWSPGSEAIAFDSRGRIWTVAIDSAAPAPIDVVLQFNPLVTLTANRTDRNADLGMEAADGVVDGGGNRARRNGDPRQCVNIGCS
jgi:TolB protein